MPIRFQCTACHAKLKVGSHKAGATKKCPICGAEIVVPKVSTEPEESRFEEEARTMAGPPLESSGAEDDRFLDAPVIDVAQVHVDRSRRRQGPRYWDTPLEIPRRTVYTLGVTLAVVACVFFLFGVLVGRISVRKSSERPRGIEARLAKCAITGSVFRRKNNERSADEKALVLILPADAVAEEAKPKAEAFHPRDGEGVASREADLIRSLGGEVLEVDALGRYRASLDADRRYEILVISAEIDDAQGASKELRATWGRWFAPVEPLVAGRAYAMRSVEAGSGTVEVEAVVFGG